MVSPISDRGARRRPRAGASLKPALERIQDGGHMVDELPHGSAMAVLTSVSVSTACRQACSTIERR
jgi:hypothetical protein